MILRELVARYNDHNPAVLKATAQAFTVLISATENALLAENIAYLRNQFNTVVSMARHAKGGVGASGVFMLPGLNQMKGIDPLVPMLQYVNSTCWICCSSESVCWHCVLFLTMNPPLLWNHCTASVC